MNTQTKKIYITERGIAPLFFNNFFYIKVAYESRDPDLNTGRLKLVPYRSLYVTFVSLKIIYIKLTFMNTKSIIRYDFKLPTVRCGSQLL